MTAAAALAILHRASAGDVGFSGDAIYNLGQYTSRDMAEILVRSSDIRRAAQTGWLVDSVDPDGLRLVVWVDVDPIRVLGWEYL